MGRYSENPRYNVMSFRASDQEQVSIVEVLAGRTMAQFLLEAAMDKVTLERQKHYDDHLRSQGL